MQIFLRLEKEKILPSPLDSLAFSILMSQSGQLMTSVAGCAYPTLKTFAVSGGIKRETGSQLKHFFRIVNFEAHGIDGQMLILLEESYVQATLGVSHTLRRKKLMKLVDQIKLHQMKQIKVGRHEIIQKPFGSEHPVVH